MKRAARLGGGFDYEDHRLSIAYARDRFLEGGVARLGQDVASSDRSRLPDVVEELWGIAAEPYRMVRGKGRPVRAAAILRCPDPLRPELDLLGEAILTWCVRYSLVESRSCRQSDPWIIDAALRTLEMRCRIPELEAASERPAKWRQRNMFSGSPGSLPPLGIGLFPHP